MLKQYVSICIFSQQDQNSNLSTSLATHTQTSTEICPKFYLAAPGYSFVFFFFFSGYVMFACSMSMIVSPLVGAQRLNKNRTSLCSKQVRIDQKCL